MKWTKRVACAMLTGLAIAGHAEGFGAEAGIGYTSVNAALQDLKIKPNVTLSVTKPDGWVIVSDPDTSSQWSFTPDGHYADPAVVRRAIKTSANGDVTIEMTGLCEASKENCDRLMKEFERMNVQSRSAVRRQIAPKSPD